MVQVMTDHPVQACLASQYAGWAISEGKYFAMGSGPMRAVRGESRSSTRSAFARRRTPSWACSRPASRLSPSVVAAIAAECKVLPSSVTLLAAPTASLAGGVQVVARSVETALHKLAELKFDLGRIQSAHGSAPCLPSLAMTWRPSVGPTTRSFTVPAWSCTSPAMMTASSRSDRRFLRPSSRDHGEPFSAIFARYNHDFYAVDPLLFSPAEVVFQNLETGRSHAFGSIETDVLARSFWG